MVSRPRAMGEVLFTAFIWGFSFVAAKWTMNGIGPMWALTIRFTLAALLTAPWWLFRFDRHHARIAFPVGVVLGATLLLQLIGLNYTTVAKSCFITVLYVVWIPFAEGLFFKRWPPYSHLIWVLIALVGTALMSELKTDEWNRGDALTLLCSLASAVHILLVGKIQTKIRSGFTFNLYQNVWAGLIPLCAALLMEPLPQFPLQPLAISGLLFNAIVVSILAFWIQVRAQGAISPSVISLLFLLESPFAALFGYLCLGETLNPPQFLGGFLILLSAVGTIRDQLRPTQLAIVEV